MKHSIVFIFVVLIFFSCGKHKSTNILVGTWNQMDQISQYVNPYTLQTEYDTVTAIPYSIEFKSDGTFFTNGMKDGTYSISNDTTFSLQPPGNISTYFYTTYTIIKRDNSFLKTRRNMASGEQEKVYDPNMQGMFTYANIQYVFIEYNKQ